MTHEKIMSELKRIERKMRYNGDTDDMVIREAINEISDWKAKYEMVRNNLLAINQQRNNTND